MGNTVLYLPGIRNIQDGGLQIGTNNKAYRPRPTSAYRQHRNEITDYISMLSRFTYPVELLGISYVFLVNGRHL